MKNTHQHVSVLAFSGIVTALMGVVIIQNMAPTSLSGSLMGTMSTTMSSYPSMMVASPSSASSVLVAEPMLVDADPNTVVVVVTDELGNEVISYTEADLNAAAAEPDDGITVEETDTAEPDDGTEPISTVTCKNKSSTYGKIFTASAGPKGTKLYSYCKEDTMKTILNDHLDASSLKFCSSFNANKYVAQCDDGCQQVAGITGTTAKFKEKERKFNITKVDDKTCKVVTGESSAYTGSATLTGDCTMTRVCEPFKSKFNQY
ncbi:MAG TPA: hypothetical protein PKV72_06845 [Candidatus Peribacteria bacterium]|nr:hypothetical protein [Candidatus Peribacteria bacterium]